MKKLKISLLNISFIFFLLFIVCITNNIYNNLSYQFIDSNYIQHVLPKYFNLLKVYSMPINNINFHENQLESP